MHGDLPPIEHLVDLDALLAESMTRPVLIFKHSRTCGTSAQALDELLVHLNDGQSGDVRFAIVTVQTHRQVSDALAARLGIRHQTPQVLLIKEGTVRWHASHFRVTADAIAEAVSRLTQVPA
jgi:thioredoxin 1